MQPLADWKNQRGLATEVVKLESAIVGTISATKIKDYIKAQYEKTGVDPLNYVLLIGDAADLPPMRKGTGDSDQAYGHIVGTDAYSEVFIGRFSAETVDQVKTQVDRTIYYEKSISTADTWIGTATGIASSEGGTGGDNGESDIAHMNVIRSLLQSYGYSPVSQVYDSPSSATASQVVAEFNAGRSLMNYVGHGSETFWVTSHFGLDNMSQLTNTNKLPFIVSVSCVSGNFVNRTCFAEGLLRSQRSGKPTGAVAIMASTINQDWSSPMLGQDAMMQILTEKHSPNIVMRTYGGFTTNGMFDMITKYGTSGFNMACTWTCFGDPSLLVRTKKPTAMQVTHEATIANAATSFVVNCNTNGALAVVSAGSKILGKALVANGKATIKFAKPFAATEAIQLTVTAFNKVSYIKSLTSGGETPTPDPDPEYAPVTNLTGEYDLTSKTVKLEWTAPAAMRSLLDEGFESGTPLSWKLIDADGDGQNWSVKTFSGHSGSRCVSSASYTSSTGALTPDNYLITPALSLPNGATLTCWVTAQDALYASEHWGIFASSTGTATSDFRELMSETLQAKTGRTDELREAATRGRAQGNWYQKTVAIPAGTKYVAFRHYNCTDQFWINLDDVKIVANTAPTPDPDPTPDPTAMSYNIYRNGKLIKNQSTTQFAEQLEESGTYKYEVEVKYAGGLSPKVAVNVTVPSHAANEDVIVSLKANDVWGDNTGYQMLLDNTATAYGVQIPTSGPLLNSCDVPATLNSKFSHRIPANAVISCSPAANQWIVTGEVTVTIPAGTYDFCFANPEPGRKIWIASGENGRRNDFVFEAGKEYYFETIKNGYSDAITLRDVKSTQEILSALKAYGLEGQVVVETDHTTLVSIFDLNGRRLSSQTITAKTSIALQPGVYVVSLASGSVKQATKVIVK